MKVPLTLWAATPPVHRVSALTVTHDRKFIITGSHTGQLCTWSLDADAHQTVPLSFVILGTDAVVTISDCWYDHHPDLEGRPRESAVMCTTADGSIFVVDPRDGRVVSSSPNLLEGSCTSVTMLGNGHFAALAGHFDDIAILELTSGSIVHHLSLADQPEWYSCSCHVEIANGEGALDAIAGVTTSGVLALFPAAHSTFHGGETQPLDYVRLRCRGVRAIAWNPHNKSTLLVVTKEEIQIYTMPDLAAACTIPTPGMNDGAWLGARFAQGSSVLCWTASNHVHRYQLPVGKSPHFQADLVRIVGQQQARSSGRPCELHEDFAVLSIASETTDFRQDNVPGTQITVVAARAPSEPWLVATSHGDGHVRVGSTCLDLVAARRGRIVSRGAQPNTSLDSKPATEAAAVSDNDVIAEGSLSDAWKNFQHGFKWLKTGDSMTCFTTVAVESEVNPLLCFGTDTGHIVIGSLLAMLLHTDCTIGVWNVETGTLIHRLANQAGEILRLSNTHEGLLPRWRNCVAAINGDNSVCIYDIDKGICAARLAGHAYPISRLRWMAEDDFLLVECNNGMVYIWQLSSTQLESTAAGKTARDIFEIGQRSTRPRAEPYILAPVVVRLGLKAKPNSLLLTTILDIERLVEVIDALFARGPRDRPRRPHEPVVAQSRSQAGVAAIPGAGKHETGQSNTETVKGTASTTRLMAICSVTHARSRAALDGRLEALWLQVTSLYAVHSDLHQNAPPRDVRMLAQYWQHRCSDLLEAAHMLMLDSFRSVENAVVKKLLAQLRGDVPSSYRPITDDEAESILLLWAVPTELLSQLYNVLQHLLEDTSAGISQRCQATMAMAVAFTSFQLLEGFQTFKVMGFLVMLTTQGHPRLAKACNDALGSIAKDCPVAFASAVGYLMHQSQQGGYPEGTLKVLRRMVQERPVVLIPQLSKVVDVVLHTLNPSDHVSKDACKTVAQAMLMDMKSVYPMLDVKSASGANGVARVVVGLTDGSVAIYDGKNGALWHEFVAHEHAATAVALDSKCKHLVTFSLADRCVRFWHLSHHMFGILGGGACKLVKEATIQDAAISKMPMRQVLNSIRLDYQDDKSARLTVGEGIEHVIDA
ncbi:uncharacterized protein MONBRDRAFT_33150 [Monosiga brevicollis MX1]|uniref:Uncharacterized protein n=1 Tax=Monosiga brevicollis TaxID=81824 RepID=A9V3Z7_MONBE|nr:uncharacterized protein MONBRDRAFT_33150 [Monosiga brevicollis MX1]EDQ87894.1 predicted protein [Monosiga brevicollis MX1]|eukprot:XP_001747427.1 hypothetical protein [Monosiga brevicollis MX1]